MPDFGETLELAESGSHSQNPGIGRIDPPPRGRGSDPGIGVFLGEAPETQEIEEFGGIRGILEMADPGGQTPRIGPNQGVRPPKTAQTDPKSPEKTPFRPKPTPKTSNSGVSDLRFRPKGGIPPKTQKSAHFLLSSPLKRPHFQESRLSSTKPPCFWHHPPVPGVAGN